MTLLYLRTFVAFEGKKDPRRFNRKPITVDASRQRLRVRFGGRRQLAVTHPCLRVRYRTKD